MNFPTEIPELEAELHRVLGMCEEDETALARSTTPEVDGIFLASLTKLRHEFEKRLHRAKAERRHEVLGLKLDGARLAKGGVPLRLLGKLTDSLNGLSLRCQPAQAQRLSTRRTGGGGRLTRTRGKPGAGS